jgi:hypothetical protein
VTLLLTSLLGLDECDSIKTTYQSKCKWITYEKDKRKKRKLQNSRFGRILMGNWNFHVF